MLVLKRLKLLGSTLPLALKGITMKAATYDPASINATATSTTMAVANAKQGDHCLASLLVSGGIVAGIVCYANCTADGTVTVTLFNGTGGAIDLASGTLRVVVFHTV